MYYKVDSPVVVWCCTSHVKSLLYVCMLPAVLYNRYIVYCIAHNAVLQYKLSQIKPVCMTGLT